MLSGNVQVGLLKELQSVIKILCIFIEQDVSCLVTWCRRMFSLWIAQIMFHLHFCRGLLDTFDNLDSAAEARCSAFVI